MEILVKKIHVKAGDKTNKHKQNSYNTNTITR